VNNALTDSARDEPNSPPSENAEFEMVSVNGGGGKREFDQFALAVETERVLHVPLEVIDTAAECPQGALPSGMNPPDIGGLVNSADYLVSQIFQPEICDQHCSNRGRIAS